MTAYIASWFHDWTPHNWAVTAAAAQAVQALVTILIVIVAGAQVADIRRQNSLWRTLQSCDRYHLEPQLIEIAARLKAAVKSGTLKKKPSAFRDDVIVMLNYLDSIAIGIFQGLYNEKLARDHMEWIVQGYVDVTLKDGMARALDIELIQFRFLLALEKRWAEWRRPHFETGWWFTRLFRRRGN